jgi:hypothetical protein
LRGIAAAQFAAIGGAARDHREGAVPGSVARCPPAALLKANAARLPPAAPPLSVVGPPPVRDGGPLEAAPREWRRRGGWPRQQPAAACGGARPHERIFLGLRGLGTLECAPTGRLAPRPGARSSPFLLLKLMSRHRGGHDGAIARRSVGPVGACQAVKWHSTMR